jgi:hypothetical protein
MANYFALRRLGRTGVALLQAGLLAGLLSGLASCSAGRPSMGFIEPRLMGAYIPLAQREVLILNHWAAAFAIAPNVAITNAHNARFIPPEMVIARSRDYDLLFFRIDNRTPPLLGKAEPGEEVIAYGQGADDELREARGKVAGLDQVVKARCDDCQEQRVMVFDARAGGGFSGGPVVDAHSGAVVGITFGYLDGKAADGGRRMYAYDMDLVIAEMRRLVSGGGEEAE